MVELLEREKEKVGVSGRKREKLGEVGSGKLCKVVPTLFRIKDHDCHAKVRLLPIPRYHFPEVHHTGSSFIATKRQLLSSVMFR